MKRELTISTLLAGTTLLGTLSYLLMKPKNSIVKKIKSPKFKVKDAEFDIFI